MSFVPHGMKVKGRALNSCQNCLRARVNKLKENQSRLRKDAQAMMKFVGYFQRDHLAHMTATATTTMTQPPLLQATQLDLDTIEQLRITIAKLDKSERDFQLELLAAEESISSLTNKNVHESSDDVPSNSLKVYRLLRSDEDPAKGLYPKDAASRMSVAQHIEKGSRLDSRFISASKRVDVCLFYANKAIYERGIDREKLRIAEIELDLSKGDAFDLTDEKKLMEQSIEKDSKAYNHATCFEEVIVERCISADEIVDVFQAVPDLPKTSSYAMFTERLRGSLLLLKK
eukprot:scaffold8182_cov110-Skeletonema_dohrnii-CCMP3373.AAC.13